MSSQSKKSQVGLMPTSDGINGSLVTAGNDVLISVGRDVNMRAALDAEHSSIILPQKYSVAGSIANKYLNFKTMGDRLSQFHTDSWE